MLLGIDHLVVAVRSVEAAEAAVTSAVGLAFTGGGRHEAWGTYNRLAFLGDTYLELIGVFDRGLVEARTGLVGRTTLALVEAGVDGLATYALAVDDIEREVAALRRDGSPIGTPTVGSRVRPDGEVIRWSTAEAHPDPIVLPFLIEHELTGAEWGVEARAARAAFRHPRGGRVRLESLELPAGDPDATGEAYGRVLGIAFSEGWRVAIGEQAVELARGDGTPVVHLRGDLGTEPADVELLGIRWVRTPRDA
jgi:hypothetical protein